MTDNLKLEGEKLILRALTLDDATPEYVSWLNDPEVSQYMESRFQIHTLETLKQYITDRNADVNTYFFAIVRKDSEKMIGSIKLGPVDRNHNRGEIGIMIGDKDSWGQGFASEAIKLISDFGFNTFKLHKIVAGVYAENMGSRKAFLKNGFEEEAVLKKHDRSKDTYTDVIRFAKFNPNSQT